MPWLIMPFINLSLAAVKARRAASAPGVAAS